MLRAKKSPGPAAEHRPLVRQAAEESLVLLQNKPYNSGSAILPLATGPHKIALIGPLADDPDEMLDLGGDPQREAGVVTVMDAFEERMKQTGGSANVCSGMLHLL